MNSLMAVRLTPTLMTIPSHNWQSCKTLSTPGVSPAALPDHRKPLSPQHSPIEFKRSLERIEITFAIRCDASR
jgi:hypothetical protein